MYDAELINEITQLLKEAGHPNPTHWETKLDFTNTREDNDVTHLNRIAIKRYWQRELRKAPIGTLYERLILAYSDNNRIWLQLFKSSLIPTIIKYNLGSE